MSNRDFRELIANGTPEEIAAEIMIFRRTASNEGFHKLLVMALTRSNSRSKGSQAFVNARAEWMRSKARKAALEEKVLSDQWIPVAVMTEAWCAIGAIMRTRYLGVPSLLAARHATLDSPQKLFDCAMNLINESLEDIQKLDLKDLPIKWEGEPDDEAA